jgi:hypothetical protein
MFQAIGAVGLFALCGWLIYRELNEEWILAREFGIHGKTAIRWLLRGINQGSFPISYEHDAQRFEIIRPNDAETPHVRISLQTEPGSASRMVWICSRSWVPFQNKYGKPKTDEEIHLDGLDKSLLAAGDEPITRAIMTVARLEALASLEFVYLFVTRETTLLFVPRLPPKELKRWVEWLADFHRELAIVEHQVMTPGDAPYRSVDRHGESQVDKPALEVREKRMSQASRSSKMPR